MSVEGEVGYKDGLGGRVRVKRVGDPLFIVKASMGHNLETYF